MSHKGNKSFKGLLCALAGALGMLAVLIVGFGGFRGFGRAAKFAAVMRIIDSKFVGECDLDETTDLALAVAVDSLDDDWSYYMDADSYDEYQDYSANLYQGIGVTIRADEATGGFLIEITSKDGPADRAGILAGDVILAVDGISVTGKTTEELRSLIQADYGKQALVTVRRADGTEEDVPVSCESIYQSPVSYEMLDGDIGYVKITNFRQGAGEDSVAAVDALLEQGAQGLVFDVRDDPGGQVKEMVTILDRLLPEGDLFIQATKSGRESIEKSDATCVEVPMAVVVNGNSYSAAEFFAAALRDYDRGVIVGQPTTGKARSQVTYTLWDNSAVHISHHTYLTPSRTDLYEEGGLEPDTEVALTEEQQLQYQNGRLAPADDPQVQAAVEAVRNA